MKYFIKTFGCQMNYSDSERISSILENFGLKPENNIAKADLIVFNTCGVRQMAEDRVYGLIHNMKKRGRKIKIIVTGCLSNREDVRKRLEKKVDLFTEIKSFSDNFKKLFSNECTILPKKYLSIVPKYKTKYTAYVPVMTGCNNFCSYCVVPHARGREISRPVSEIIKEVKGLINKNYKEIILLGQNVNSYKYKGTDFPKLLERIHDIPGYFWLSYLTSHPKDMTDKLIEITTRLPKMCEYIHLPIQAGDDKILQKMNRGYTAKHYLKLIEKIKKRFEKYKPGMPYYIASDIIVGFPGETKKQFAKSAEIIKKVSFDMVYFGQYSPRPGTRAWRMEDNITKKEKVRREKYLTDILRKTSLENNKSYLGNNIEVLVDSEKNGFYFGRTRTYKKIKFPATKKNFIGKFVDVKVRKINPFSLEARLDSRNLVDARRGEIAKEKVVVILGPTASGKSDAAIKLARKFNGEIISADSRQIYKGMDIGSGKVTKQEQKLAPHHMLDIVSPNTDYNAAKFKREAEKIVEDILKREKVPIICGGTGFWIKSIVDNIDFPGVKPDWDLRKRLSKKTTTEISTELKKLDPERYGKIEKNNKVRLIRAIEIARALGKVPKNIEKDSKYEFLQIGIDVPKRKLDKKIEKRLDQRLRQGMIEEVKNLHKKKVSWKRLESFGLEYRWVARFLQNKISREEMRKKLYFDIIHYAKRQMTWFRKDKRIKWIKNYSDIQKETEKFLKN